MIVDKFQHMEEAWKQETNPFPSDAIRQSSDQPYSPDVYPEETSQFYLKFIRGGIQGNRKVGFLWSQGPGGDTGYGKTTLMQVAAQEINEDFGEKVLIQAGMPPTRIVPIAAVYTNLHNLGAAGLYPVLFQATVDAATSPLDGESIFDKAWDRIASQVKKKDPKTIRSQVIMAWLRIAPGGAPLRSELVEAFANDKGSGVQIALSEVTHVARLRNGLYYLDFLIAVLAAAGIDHLYIFVDQLEDLATNQSITSAKRSKEIGRIRDLIETQPYASRLHFIFTFHNSAAQKLERFWVANRLPRFENIPANAASVVVLKGIISDEVVADVLQVHLENRLEPVNDDLLPFDQDVLPVLRQASQGRIGVLLAMAHELFDAAASRALPRITGDFAARHLQNGSSAAEFSEEEDDTTTSDIDDLLLG